MTPENPSDADPTSPEPREQSETQSARSEPPEQIETPSAEPAESGESAFAEAAGAQDSVNSQITDAITQALKATLGSGPSPTGASLTEIVAQSSGLAMLNAVTAQQNAQITANATTLRIVAEILSPSARSGTKP